MHEADHLTAFVVNSNTSIARKHSSIRQPINIVMDI
jgi:hypothetical protein